MSYQAEGVIEWLREKPADLFPRNHHAADLIQSQQQRIEALEEENRTLKSFVRGEVNIIPVDAGTDKTCKSCNGDGLSYGGTCPMCSGRGTITDTTKADEVKNEQKTK